MRKTADLEISFHRHGMELDDVKYEVEFRFSQPESDVEIRLDQKKRVFASFNRAALLANAGSPDRYGQALTEALFADPEMRNAFVKFRSIANSNDFPLRMRMVFGPTAAELHSLHWETLRDPENDTPLCFSENLFFSRYVSSSNSRPIRLRPKGALRALAVVANPADLEKFGMAKIDAAAELEQARAGLADIPLVTLPGPADGQRATLNHLMQRLRDEAVDILYLVCHGKFKNEETFLWLEDENGQSAITPGSELVTRIQELAQRPRLIILVVCQSAGKDEAGSLAALGPRLADAGVSAVMAMQGEFSFETAARFIPTFFEELKREGLVDRAAALARGAVRQRYDYWAPVLFMRLKTGRLWYTPGFSGESSGSDPLPRLLLRMKKYLDRPTGHAQVTPVLGHGLVEPMLGSLREMAENWANVYHYPMAPSERKSLPQVAQYLSVEQDDQYPLESLEESIYQTLKTRFPGILPAGKERITLDEMIQQAGSSHRKGAFEPHRMLAKLPLPVYITANYDHLLEDALLEANRKPEVVVCPWFRDADDILTVYDREKYIPTLERPLVFHLFGQFEHPRSVVLTEDDFFDYLLGVARNKDRIPDDVRRALANSTLLFIGFQLEDWNFRVLLRSIVYLAAEGSVRRSEFKHIAAQIEPEEGSILEPDGARRYIEKYFSHDANVSLYWGNVEDFLNELQQRWARLV